MIRCTLAILLGIAVPQSLGSQAFSGQASSPSVSVVLPVNLDSEAVQISYFMVGPFGGYGGYTKQDPSVRSYEIAASVEGRAATQIKIIVYASGCEIRTFVLAVQQDSKLKEEFQCQAVPAVRLSGQVVPSELVRDRNTELVITYMAFWAHEFFGITDGPVTEFRLAILSPDEHGMFQVDLPDFSADDPTISSRENATFHLMLRDVKTWNHIASNLEPDLIDFRSMDHGLIIRPSYPSHLNFSPAPHQ